MTRSLAKRFTLAEYQHLADLGLWADAERVELIRGEIFQMAAKGTPHSVCATRLNRELPKLVGDRATCRSQEPIIIPPHSAPEPDYAIAQNRDDDYLAAHPTPAELLLVIEIADSSLDYDQEVKLKLYAEAGIQHYWIFNLVERVLEVYSQPYQKPQGDFGYRHTSILLPNETIALPQFAGRSLDLVKVFPDG